MAPDTSWWRMVAREGTSYVWQEVYSPDGEWTESSVMAYAKNTRNWCAGTSITVYRRVRFPGGGWLVEIWQFQH